MHEIYILLCEFPAFNIFIDSIQSTLFLHKNNNFCILNLACMFERLKWRKIFSA